MLLQVNDIILRVKLSCGSAEDGFYGQQLLLPCQSLALSLSHRALPQRSVVHAPGVRAVEACCTFTAPHPSKCGRPMCAHEGKLRAESRKATWSCERERGLSYINVPGRRGNRVFLISSTNSYQRLESHASHILTNHFTMSNSNEPSQFR